MFDLFSNSWFISIVGGLVVTFLWESIKFVRERNAYNRRLRIVRNDFSINIKNIIGEGILPELYILDNLLKGISQKHEVKYKDVSDVEPVFNSLTQDVMESSFLDYENKLIFCRKLETMNKDYTQYIKEKETKTSENESTNKFKSRDYVSIIPTFAFLMLSIVTILIGTTIFLDNDVDYYKILFETKVDNGIVIIMAILYGFIFGFFVLIRQRNRRRDIERKDEEIYRIRSKMFKDL